MQTVVIHFINEKIDPLTLPNVVRYTQYLKQYCLNTKEGFSYQIPIRNVAFISVGPEQ